MQSWSAEDKGLPAWQPITASASCRMAVCRCNCNAFARDTRGGDIPLQQRGTDCYNTGMSKKGTR